jgi:hypothetical protein
MGFESVVMFVAFLVDEDVFPSTQCYYRRFLLLLFS